MSKTHFFALATLVACFSASPAFAYPHAGQKHIVSAGGASWTVLQDHQSPLRWYYVPAAARLVESSNQAGKPQPELALLKYQAHSPTNKSLLVDNAFFFFTLGLTPEKATLAQLTNAIAQLKPMQDAKATVKDIRLEEIALQDIKLKLPEIRAEAAPDEGFGLPIPATALQFTLHLPGVGPDIAQKLQSQGLKVQLEFNYVAATPKPDSQPARVSIGGQIAGAIGLAGYPKAVQDQSITILPSGEFNTAFLRLPPAFASSGVKQIDYMVTLLAPDGKQVPGFRADTVSWKATADTLGWTDKDRRPRPWILFPLKGLADYAKKTGAHLADYKLKIDGQFNMGNRQEKFSGTTALLIHDAPVTVLPPFVTSLSLSPEFLEPTAIDPQCQELAAAQIKLACGRITYPMQFKFVNNAPPPGTPMTFLFDNACGSVKLEGILNCKSGKRYALTARTVGNAPGATVYLESAAN